MKLLLQSLAVTAALIVSTSALSQTPAVAPAGSTGLCKDGSYTTNEAKKGACAGHKGVKDWFGVAGNAPAATGAVAASAPAATAIPATPTATVAKTPGAPSTPSAAGGGPGQVWVNATSKVYHCYGTKYYGKTKQGEYMSEAAAKSAGNHADHGKACSS